MDQTECPLMLSILSDMYPGNLPNVDANVELPQSENHEQPAGGQSLEQSAGSQSLEQSTGSHSEHTTGCAREKKPRTPLRASVTLSKNNGRLKCWLENSLIQPSHATSRIITRIIKERLEPDGPNWSEVTEQTKEFYWGEFKKHCYWDDVNDVVIKHAWKRKAGGRYKDLLYNVRRGKLKNEIVESETKKAWEEKWNTPGFKKRSDINSKNRNTENGPILHTSGSLGFDEYSSHLAGKLTRPCTPHELFLATHISKEDREKLIDERARLFNEKCNTVRAEKMRLRGGIVDDKDFMAFEVEVYMEALGEDKKYLYGLGCEGVKYLKRKRPSTDSTSSALGQAQIEDIMSELREMRGYKEKYDNLRAEMQDEIQKSVDAQLEKFTQQQMQRMMTEQWIQMQQQMQLQMEQQMSQQLPFGPLTNMLMQAQQPAWMPRRFSPPTTSSPGSTPSTSGRISPDKL